jgi:hypothetical protein
VLMWVVAGLLPVLVLSTKKVTLPKTAGVTFLVLYLLFGLHQLSGAIRSRQWSDIVAFGLVPALLLLASAITYSIYAY